MTHVRTSPYYPQSNGKIERFHQTIKDECIRPGVQLSLDNVGKVVGRYINYYNAVRLHSSIGYVSSVDKLIGRDQEIFQERDGKCEAARKPRKQNRRKTFPGFNIPRKVDIQTA
ncbi:MAG: transposase [Smithellaceae bacterium]|nr:transposase [Smithellaceae bacterium]